MLAFLVMQFFDMFKAFCIILIGLLALLVFVISELSGILQSME